MKKVNANHLKPAVAVTIHPGEILKAELIERGIKQRIFAGDLGMAANQMNEILKGKRNISPEVAILIESALGIEAIFWMNLQASYDINRARLDAEIAKKAENIKNWKTLKNNIPFTYFRKEKILNGDPETDIETICSIYSLINAQDILSSNQLSGLHRFKKSSAHQIDEKNLTGWVRYVEFLASQQKVKSFDFNNQEQLIETLRNVFSQKNILQKIEKLLAEFGIKFIVQKKPDKVPVDGITFWSNEHPVIAITQRYSRLDNLAFTIMHEVGHIFLHLKKDKTKQFIDDVESSKGGQVQEEKEANTFAEDQLIPRNMWKNFMLATEEFNSTAIKDFAKTVNIHPAIALGRLKKEQHEYYRRRFSISNEIL